MTRPPDDGEPACIMTSEALKSPVTTFTPCASTGLRTGGARRKQLLLRLGDACEHAGAEESCQQGGGATRRHLSDLVL